MTLFQRGEQCFTFVVAKTTDGCDGITRWIVPSGDANSAGLFLDGITTHYRLTPSPNGLSIQRRQDHVVEPESLQLLDDAKELVEVHRLGDEGIHVQHLALDFVGFVLGCRQDDDWDLFE